jgi:hypothetical protein
MTSASSMPVITSPTPRRDSFVNGTPNAISDDSATDLFQSLKISSSRDDGNGPQHDVAVNSHTHNERVKTAMALGERTGPLPGPLVSTNGHNGHNSLGIVTPPQNSRPNTPYTMNPPVDFDGLSWPSESLGGQSTAFGEANQRARPGNKGPS